MVSTEIGPPADVFVPRTWREKRGRKNRVQRVLGYTLRYVRVRVRIWLG